MKVLSILNFFGLVRHLLDAGIKIKSFFKVRPQRTVTHIVVVIVFVADHPNTNGKVSKITVPNQPKPEEEPPPSNP